MNSLIILATLSILSFLSLADSLPKLEDIIKTQDAPVKIEPTGKRETIEPKENGKNHGLARYYHPNGQLYGVIPWKEGNKHGSFKLYHENGKLDQYLEYKDGKLDGIAVWMAPDESVSQFSEYVQNKPLGVQGCLQKVYLKDLEENKVNLREGLFSSCTMVAPKVKLPTKQTKIESKIKPNPSFNCAKAKTKTEIAICDSLRLARLDLVINERYERVLKTIPKSQKLSLKKEQRGWLELRERCGDESDSKQIERCILKSIEERIDELNEFYSRIHVVNGNKNEAQKLIKEIEGEYRSDYDGGMMNGETYKSEDKLIISPVEDKPTTIEFDIFLNFFNGHSCSMAGRAFYTNEKEFVFVDSDPESKCKLRFRKVESGVQYEDRDNECKSYCGMRGSFSKEVFEFKYRRKN